MRKVRPDDIESYLLRVTEGKHLKAGLGRVWADSVGYTACKQERHRQPSPETGFSWISWSVEDCCSDVAETLPWFPAGPLGPDPCRHDGMASAALGLTP